GVGQAARRLGLALEAARELLLAAELGEENLDGQIPPHHRVLGAIDRAHAADADAAHDPVALADDGADHGIGDRRPAARTEGSPDLNPGPPAPPPPPPARQGPAARPPPPPWAWTLPAAGVASGGLTTATTCRLSSRIRRAARCTSAGLTFASSS